MKNRILTPRPEERKGFGLLAWLEKTRIALPLKGVECSFAVCGDLVSVELDQIFEQNSRQALDCLYSFPLPAGAAVYRCEMHVNGRVIRAKVEERSRAQELAREMKAAGHRTALVEMERDNLFTLSLGNVQPGDLIVIRFAYFQVLTRLAEWTSFRIPFCPGVRYIPGVPLLRAPKGHGSVDDTDQVPDASRISPPRIDGLHRDAAYVSVQGKVEHQSGELENISSPSHVVLVTDRTGCSSVSLAEHGAVPDSDFVLRWSETQAEEVKPTGWLLKGSKESFALLRLRAPMQVATTENHEQDFYFLIDRSGSMEGLKWKKAVEAFQEFLKILGKQDRVWATFFESHFRDLAEKPLPAAELISDHGVGNLEKLGAGGGTELLAALEHVVEKVAEHSTQRPVSLVLITDGQVGNEAQILQRLARHPQLRVHVFGVDVAINDGFLNKLAAQHQGTSCLLSPQDDIVGAVKRLGDRLQRPVWTGIKVSDDWELPAAQLPDLHAGEVLSLPLKARACSVTERLTVEATVPGDAGTMLQFVLTQTDAVALRLLWAKQRIDFLLAQGRTNEAITLAKENNVVCEGAAFIAWDEAEKVAISDREVYQPALKPRMMRAVSKFAVAGETLMDAQAAYNGYDFGNLRSFGNSQGRHELNSGNGLYEITAAESAIENNVMDWQTQMNKDPLFLTPAGVQLLQQLAAWANGSDSGPGGPLSWLHLRRSKNNVRVAQLMQLGASLGLALNKAPAERIEMIRQWIELHLEGKFKETGLEILQRIERELAVQAEAGLG